MRLRTIIATLPLAFAACEGQEERPVITNASVEHYEVNGSDCDEASQDMESKGYIIDGEWRAGKANVGLSYEGTGYKPIEQPGNGHRKEYCCKAVIDPLVAVCEGKVYLPQWDGNDKCWDRFIDALTTHEQGHVDLCMDFAGRLRIALTGLESTKCSIESMQKACDDAVADLEQKADEAYNAVDGDYGTADGSYDLITGHGAAQGVKLECDCE